MDYRYIAIEGNIGSGKTTLAERLAGHYNAKLILEQFADNPFLAKFYEEPGRYAFPLELSFLADRYNQLKTILPNRDIFQDTIVSDVVAAPQFHKLVLMQIFFPGAGDEVLPGHLS